MRSSDILLVVELEDGTHRHRASGVTIGMASASILLVGPEDLQVNCPPSQDSAVGVDVFQFRA